MLSCGWLWLYTGAFLMLMELVSPGFVIFFFGLSASTVGLVRFALGGSFTPTWQLIAFSAFSILYLAFLRRWLKKIFSGSVSRTAVDFDSDFVGRAGVVTEAIEPPLPGRAMIGDAEWTAVADAPVEKGASVVVVSQQNLTMKVAQR